MCKSLLLMRDFEVLHQAFFLQNVFVPKCRLIAVFSILNKKKRMVIHPHLSLAGGVGFSYTDL